MIKSYFYIAAMLLPLCATSAVANNNQSELEGFETWKENFREQAIQAGIGAKTVDTVLSRARFNAATIRLDRKQPEGVKSFEEYLDSMVTVGRIERSAQYYQANKALLDKIGRQYGVPPQYIVALISIESDFGKNMGKSDLISALATLAYEGRRSELFSRELISLMEIVEKEGVPLERFKGSWAGAFGQCQFMPSSYLRYAVDYDGDGKKDLWNSKGDIYASVANYLSTVGWDKTIPWGQEAIIPDSFDLDLADRTIKKPFGVWADMGVKLLDRTDTGIKNAELLAVIAPGKQRERVFLVTQNYSTIMDWNRSTYFATSVGLLADGIIGR